MKAACQKKNSWRASEDDAFSHLDPFTHRLTSLLGAISKYRVLLVGDGIIDEYVYVKPQGKSPKENIISNKVLHSERFSGGAWAAAAHVRGFVENVQVQTATTTTVKRRFVETGYIRKLFETHEEEEAPQELAPDPAGFDLAIVADFGHGCLTPNLIERLTASKTFLAVNAQTNSANLGFNLITKYPRADYVVLDELEARLAAHDRDSRIEDVILKLGFQRIIVTLGPNGAIGYDGQFHREAGKSALVVDTMGAGDAFFCVTAPFAAAGASMKELLVIGNAAGAIKCSVVGHRQSVTKQALVDYLTPSSSQLKRN
jgi:bifunctional ADP-heptose synthase (sugar kinase/adenylyltransferase)